MLSDKQVEKLAIPQFLIDYYRKFTKKYTILLVEDDNICIKVYESFIKKLGYSYIIAKDGEEAIRMFNEHYFNVIITDIGLPKISGQEVSKYIRKKDPEIAIIGQTGYGDIYDKEYEKSGMDAVIIKPFTLAKLEKILIYLLNKEDILNFTTMRQANGK